MGRGRRSACRSERLVGTTRLQQKERRRERKKGESGKKRRETNLSQTTRSTPPLTSHANTTNLLDAILARGTLRVGTTGDYRPFTYRLPTNTTAVTNNTTAPSTAAAAAAGYLGADIALAHALSAALALPHPVTFVPTTWPTLSADLAAHAFDIAMSGVSITLPRAQRFFFSAPAVRAGKVAAVRCAAAARFPSLAALDAAGVTVVANAGGTNEAFGAARLQRATRLVLPGNGGVYDAVRDGRADAMISDVNEVALEVRLSGGELCMVGDAGAPWTFEQLGFMMPRDEVWRSFVDVWLAMEVGSGALNVTMEEWMSFDWNAV